MEECGATDAGLVHTVDWKKRMRNKLVLLITLLFKRLFLPPRTIAVTDSSDLSGITIVITGASQGVGKEIALFLARSGAQVIALARNEKKLENLPVLETLETISCDVTDSSSVKQTVESIMKSKQKIDVWINNAGLFLDKPIQNYSDADIDELLTTNVRSLFLTIREVIPHMLKKKSGLIINMGSKISHNSGVEKHKVAYATTKYALEGFSTSLRRELAGTGIRVSCLLPATVSTFPSIQADEYLAPQEIAATVAHIITQPHTQFEHILVQSIDQEL